MVLAATLILNAADFFSQQTANRTIQARLTEVSGVVLVKPPNAPEGIEAQVSTVVEEGSEVSTARASHAIVQFPDGSTIQLSERTQAVLTTAAPKGRGIKSRIMALEQGVATFHFSSGGHDAYRIRVGDVELNPRGKAIFQTELLGNHAQVQVRDGSVRVAGRSQFLTLNNGHGLRFYAFATGSSVRVARLSYVRGKVAVKPPDAKEWQAATVNTPLQQGFELSTFGDSYAEVEFVDGSTARLGEFSLVKLDQLGAGPESVVANGLTVKHGYATFHLLAGLFNTYRVKVGDATLTAKSECEFRTDFAQERYRVEVLLGSVVAAASTLTANLGKGQVWERQAGSTEATFNIRKGITPDAWDRWAEVRDEQAERAAKEEYINPEGPRYGWNELDTYGEWVEFKGYAHGWMPYAPAGWQPYTQGRWDWYPALGWTWVSSEPWGWVPYHCGEWKRHASFGWIWMLPAAGCPSWEPRMPSAFPPPFGQGPAAPSAPASAPTAESGLNFTSGHTSAPPAVLMDGDPTAETTLLSGYFPHATKEPLRFRGGLTLGGDYVVHGAPGEFRGEFFGDGAFTRYLTSNPLTSGAQGVSGTTRYVHSFEDLPVGPEIPPTCRQDRPPVVSHLRGKSPAPLYPDHWLVGPNAGYYETDLDCCEGYTPQPPVPLFKGCLADVRSLVPGSGVFFMPSHDNRGRE